jgi:putative phosphoribosyl transferase
LYPPHIAPLFNSRQDAGRQLALKLSDYKDRAVVVLGIPNGGMHLAIEIARSLKAVLDVVVVRKLPQPLHPESGFGAVADDGSYILNEELVQRENISRSQIDEQVSLVTGQVRQRSLLYRKDRPLSLVRGKTAIIVDDGLASGYTMLAAVESVKRRRAGEIVVAVPVASAVALEVVRKSANVVDIAESAASHFTVSDYYRHWHDVPDSDVIKILDMERQIEKTI